MAYVFHENERPSLSSDVPGRERIMTRSCELSADVVCAGAGLHPNLTARKIGKPPFKLFSRCLQLENDRSVLIEAHQVEDVLADIDADCDDRG